MKDTVSVVVERPTAGRARLGQLVASVDAQAVTVLSFVFVLVLALTWRKWGTPEIDAGAELTTADRLAHGVMPYSDIRYYYGPLGLFALAGAFRVLGTSMDVVFAFGIAQSIAILGVFYVLARQWLRPLVSALATAVVLTIGFSGTASNLVLPHTNSATFGLLFLLIELLAIARGRPWIAGVALGAVGLTRPEFVLAAVAAAALSLIGRLRDDGGRMPYVEAAKIAAPASAIVAVVYGALAASVGAHRLVTDNLWPVAFIRKAGFRSQANWMPLTPSSIAGLLGRGFVYLVLLAAFLACVAGFRRAAGRRRKAAALWPAPAAVAVVACVDAAARAFSPLDSQRTAIETEARHLMIGMSWLPLLSIAVAAALGIRFVRTAAPPLGGVWAADLALGAAALCLGVRAYNVFTTEASYAPYYAPPLVLLLAVLHEHLGRRWPGARPASYVALGCVAGGLGVYALVGLYADKSFTVRAPRGSYVADTNAGPALQRAVDVIEATTRSGDAILAAPADSGLYFLTGRHPVTRELTMLPGLLATRADETAAIRALVAAHAPLALISYRDFSAYGYKTFGVDYDRTFVGWLERHALARLTIGTPTPVGGTYPSRGYRVLALTPDAAERLRRLRH